MERLARRLCPGQVATKLVSPEPYEHDRFTLEGHELRIIDQGRTDAPDTTSLHVPSIGLIVAGDVVYNQCRMYVGDTTPESRKNWIAALDRLAALEPDHCRRRSQEARRAPTLLRRSKTPSVTSCRTSIGCRKIATSDQELFDQMTALYPHWVANQSWLLFRIPNAVTHPHQSPMRALHRDPIQATRHDGWRFPVPHGGFRSGWTRLPPRIALLSACLLFQPLLSAFLLVLPARHSASSGDGRVATAATGARR